jgi:transposase InsO family protein
MDTHSKEKAILRHRAVSLVLARTEAGLSVSAAIDEVLQNGFVVLSAGQRLRASRRTLHRWIERYQAKGFDALAPANRRLSEPSRILSPKFVEFLVTQKNSDPEASIPEVIRSAELLGIVGEDELSRTTVWRAAAKANLPLIGVQKKSNSTKRRFEYKHRMQMVLCDGKHFRAGVGRKRRVVFTFIDDSTRKVLGVTVCRSENRYTFLKGLYEVILHFGKMVCLYLDNGSGFISNDGYLICARLGIHLINGTEGYPEGHGKIERYNRTQYGDLLRTLAGDPSVHDSFASLETRIGHYTFNLYNNRSHESLHQTPNEKWRADSLPLRVVDDKDALAREFLITKTHKVSADNIVKAGGQLLEMPFGYAGTKVHIAHHLLDKEFGFLHEGKMILLKPVNLAVNAKTKRSGRLTKTKPENSHGPIRTAARIAYEKVFEPIVTSDGDFIEPNKTHEE